MKATQKFFASAAEFRRWLEANHATATELTLGFYNKASGKGGITYPDALEEALCFGWIDGIRRRVDADRYTIRFTPRRTGSNWSLVNVGHVKRLTAAGRMHPAGLKTFETRDRTKAGRYSFENRPEKFPASFAKVFRANKPAWRFWLQQPPGYRRTAIWWVLSAKQNATRQRRLAQLIADSANSRRLAMLGK